MTTLLADLETDNLLPDMTRIWCVSLADAETPDDIITYADQPDHPPLADAYKRLRGADRVVFHNGLAFDLPALRKMGCPLHFAQIFDTLVATRLLWADLKGHSLEAWGVRLKVHKQDHNEWDRWSQAMGERCAQDVRVMTKLYEAIQRKLEKEDWGGSLALEHKVALAISLQVANGFRLDVDKAEMLVAELRQEQVNLERELQVIYPPIWVPNGAHPLFTPKRDHKANGYTEGCPLTKVTLQTFNPGSRAEIELRLKKQYGWKPSKFTATGQAKLDVVILNELAVEYPEAKTLARFFRLNKQLGQMADGDAGWLKLYREARPGDFRVYGSVNPNGAITGRMSHFKPNLANVDRKDLRMREVWIPRDGWKLVGTDAKSLELRILAHYVGRWDKGKYATTVVFGNEDDGTDVHTRTMKATPVITRDGAKTETYAFLYGAGLAKLGLIVVQDHIEHGAPRPAGKLVAIGKMVRRGMSDSIPGLDQLIAGVGTAYDTRGYVTGLDGRRITLRSKHAALNSLLQGGGGIVMKKALAIFHFELCVTAGFVSPDFMETTNFAYCVNVHDEVQLEVEPRFAAALGQLFSDAITEAGERLKLRCPLGATYAIGDNWKETH